MFSPRRTAQLGLGGAVLLFVSSVFVLVAGAWDTKRITTLGDDTQTPTAVSAMADASQTSQARALNRE